MPFPDAVFGIVTLVVFTLAFIALFSVRDWIKAAMGRPRRDLRRHPHQHQRRQRRAEEGLGGPYDVHLTDLERRHPNPRSSVRQPAAVHPRPHGAAQELSRAVSWPNVRRASSSRTVIYTPSESRTIASTASIAPSPPPYSGHDGQSLPQYESNVDVAESVRTGMDASCTHQTPAGPASPSPSPSSRPQHLLPTHSQITVPRPARTG